MQGKYGESETLYRRLMCLARARLGRIYPGNPARLNGFAVPLDWLVSALPVPGSSRMGSDLVVGNDGFFFFLCATFKLSEFSCFRP